MSKYKSDDIHNPECETCKKIGNLLRQLERACKEMRKAPDYNAQLEAKRYVFRTLDSIEEARHG